MSIFKKPLNEKYESMREEVEHLSNELKEKENLIKLLTKTNNDSEEKSKELEKIIDQQTTSIDNMSNELAQGKEKIAAQGIEIDTLKKEIESSQQTIETLQKELDSLKESLTAIRNERDKVAKKLEEQEKNNKEMPTPPPFNIPEKVPTQSESNDKKEQEQAQNIDYTKQLNDIQASIKHLSAEIGEHAYKDKVIKDLHDDLMKKNNDFYAELKTPAIKTIIKCHNRICDTFAHYSKIGISDDPKAYDKLLKQVEVYISSIRDILDESFDLTYFEPGVGDEFNPKQFASLEIVPTDDKSLDKKVASCIHGGFVNMTTGRTIEKALIRQYKYTPIN